MKLFISIPVNGRSDDEVAAQKKRIVDRVQVHMHEFVELIDSYVSENAPVNADSAGVWYLGESLKRLAMADAAYFAPGWQTARGCRIERAVCTVYNIPILYGESAYRERFKAEYAFIKDKYDRLSALLEKWDAGTLDFKPDCPRRIYNLQIRAMEDYVAVLEARAAIEGVKLCPKTVAEQGGTQ